MGAQWLPYGFTGKSWCGQKVPAPEGDGLNGEFPAQTSGSRKVALVHSRFQSATRIFVSGADGAHVKIITEGRQAATEGVCR